MTSLDFGGEGGYPYLEIKTTRGGNGNHRRGFCVLKVGLRALVICACRVEGCRAS